MTNKAYLPDWGPISSLKPSTTPALECHWTQNASLRTILVQLERSATEQDVKKAFKRLSLQYHPDKNSAPEAVPVYLKISQAYRALTGWHPRYALPFLGLRSCQWWIGLLGLRGGTGS